MDQKLINNRSPNHSRHGRHSHNSNPNAMGKDRRKYYMNTAVWIRYVLAAITGAIMMLTMTSVMNELEITRFHDWDDSITSPWYISINDGYLDDNYSSSFEYDSVDTDGSVDKNMNVDDNYDMNKYADNANADDGNDDVVIRNDHHGAGKSGGYLEQENPIKTTSQMRTTGPEGSLDDRAAVTTDNEVRNTSGKKKKNQKKKYPQLPDKLFTVVGMDPSGISFVSTALAHALGLEVQADEKGMWGWITGSVGRNSHSSEQQETLAQGMSSAYFHHEEYLTEIQRIPIPWNGNGNCEEHMLAFKDNIVPVVYPGICMSALRNQQQEEMEESQNHPCLDWMQEEDRAMMLSNTTKTKKPVRQLLQERYLLNITSHLEWYLERGVDAYLIIVSRDLSISKKEGMAMEHCKHPDVRKAEENAAFELIDYAINRYMVSPINPPTHPSPKKGKNVFKNQSYGKAILVSYEMLHWMKDSYLHSLYDYFEIMSSFSPEQWKDANAQHIDKVEVRRKRNAAKHQKSVGSTINYSVLAKRKIADRRTKALIQARLENLKKRDSLKIKDRQSRRKLVGVKGGKGSNKQKHFLAP